MGTKFAMWTVFLAAMAMTVVGCSGSSGNSGSLTETPPATENPVATGAELVDRAITDWLGMDYAFHGPDGGTPTAPDGTADSDGDGEIDANDAVIFIESLRALGYDLPATTIDGLYHNEYTAEGYTYSNTAEVVEFSYSLDSPVSQSDLQAGDWSGLDVGDMIFVDFDMDFDWDNCALYIGAYEAYTHAAILASDFYDEVVIVDLDDPDEVLWLDITGGFSDVRKPDFANFADSYTP